MGRYQDEYNKICPYCEEQFEANRINQTYCSHRCKYTFNNRKRKKRENETGYVNNTLRKNYSILKVLFNNNNQNPEKKISKVRLLDMGYSFRYITQVINLGKGKDGLGIYNLALLNVGDGYYKIDKIA